jgi:uncharacterized protein YfbU (UPF0304 family)
MNRTLVCLISGKKYIFAKEYYSKKIEEFGDEDTLKKYFVTKKVKSLITRGYTADEIRNLLEIDSKDLVKSDCQDVVDIINYHRMKAPQIKKTTTNILADISDPEVSVFINNIR